MADDIKAAPARVTDYDAIADRFDKRYRLHSYDGVRDALLGFVGEAPAVLDVGCGTGHWLRALPPRQLIAGIDPSGPMLARAAAAATAARLVRARAEALPWRDATFDRVICINALHHFGDREGFFVEALRVLKPGGGLMTIGKDPHTEHDSWWVYDYFEETRAIDRARFARVRTLRGELTHAGYAWSESFEADRVEALYPAADALQESPAGVVDPAFTSQLTVLTEEEFARGVQRIRQANEDAGHELQLVADVRLYATVGWKA
jgi:ubiquinone/menaquinone biosynthesis C-methylase UbiE